MTKSQTSDSIELIAQRLKEVLALIDEAKLGPCGAYVQQALDMLSAGPDESSLDDWF